MLKAVALQREAVKLSSGVGVTWNRTTALCRLFCSTRFVLSERMRACRKMKLPTVINSYCK